MSFDGERIDELRGRYERCFGCGRGNPMGLRLDGFTRIGDGIEASFVPRPEYAGFEDTLHGGIVATALDETSAWAAMLTHGVLVFTATLDIRYRAQAVASHRFALRGEVEERRGRRLRVVASMRDGDTVVAESRGLFVVAEDLSADLEATAGG